MPAKLSTDVTPAMSEFRHDAHILNIGTLLLAHPSGPRPEVLLAQFREHSADPTSLHFTPKNHQEARFKESFARRLEKVLRSQNRPMDADWVAGVAKLFSDAAASFARKAGTRSSSESSAAAEKDRNSHWHEEFWQH